MISDWIYQKKANLPITAKNGEENIPNGEAEQCSIFHEYIEESYDLPDLTIRNQKNWNKLFVQKHCEWKLFYCLVQRK